VDTLVRIAPDAVQLPTRDDRDMETENPMHRLLIVDDDNDIRTLLAEQLGRAGYLVSTAADGTAMRQLLDREHVDLIVLDLNLPREDGLTLCRDLRARSNTPVIMLTARAEPIDRVLGLEMGADDYLAKPFAFAELLARVRTLLRRGQVQPQAERIIIADLVVDTLRRRVERGGQRIALSQKEYTLLELLARRRGEVLPRSLIASQVWDMNFDSDTNVIDVAIRRLRAKIDDDFDAKLIVTVRGMGYVLEAPDDGAVHSG